MSSSYRSQKATAAQVTLLEKLDIIPTLATILVNTFASMITGAFTQDRPPTYFRHVALTALRTATRRLSVRQQHFIFPNTDDAYVVACKSRNVKPNSEVLEDGTKAHWIGNSKAEKVILNFHGGGYVVPASPNMFEFMFQIVDVLKSQGKDVAVLFLSYDLAPGAVYPRQLQQAAALFTHVTSTLKISPSNIILTGDSAGANLAIALLSHISHPHPSTTVPITPITLSQPIRGAVFISPWISFDTSSRSMTTNANKDCIGPAAAEQWSSAFMGSPWPHTSATDNYSQPIMAPENWWKDLQVENILVVSGSDEILADPIDEFQGKLRNGVEMGENWKKGNLQYVVVQGEYHDQPNVDISLGYPEAQEGKQAKLIKNWISSKL